MHRYFITALVAAALFVSSPAMADASHPAKIGVYEGAGCTGVKGLAAVTAWSGKPGFGRVLDFLPVGSGWSGMVSEMDWMLGCWSKNQDLIVSVPILPSDGKSTLKLGATGVYDTYFTQIAQKLVKAGRGTAVVRLGWEFNGGWFTWAAAKDPASFLVFWQRIVTAMRAVPGAHFEFDWCPSWGYQQGETPKYYPGDTYVDIIGMDVYNQWWNAQDKDPKQRWTDLVNQQYGLSWQVSFAALHKKEISWPEWGTGNRPDGHGGGDDPYFMTQMMTWIGRYSAQMNYFDYWDYNAGDYNAKLSDNHQPLSGEAFLKYYNWSPAALAAMKAAIAKTSE